MTPKKKTPIYPPEFARGMVKTVNQMGVTTLEMSPTTEDFVRIAAFCRKPVLDIGCGYGVSSLAALNTGARVIAFDLSKEHLDVLSNNTPNQWKKNLTTRVGRFPHDLHLEPKSLSAIHASMILHFLSGEDLTEGLRQCYEAMEQGGYLFLANMTPYLGIYDTEKLIKEYNKRVSAGESWPGYIDHISLIKEEWKNSVPKFAHFFKIDTLVRYVTAAGFEVEEAYYYTLNCLADNYKNNGKEFVGLRAIKC